MNPLVKQPWRIRLIDEWRRAHKLASVRVAGFFGALFVVMPVLAEQWPNVAPTFVFFFPHNGEQIAPIVGVVLMILARLIKFYRKDDVSQ